MVESKQAGGDGVHRPIHYADWRTDKPASPGYSPELVGSHIDPKYYDDLDSYPSQYPGVETLLGCFDRNVQENPDAPFLGSRVQQADGTFGDYEWLTRAEVDRDTKNLAKGLMKGNLCPEVDGERAS